MWQDLLCWQIHYPVRGARHCRRNRPCGRHGRALSEETNSMNPNDTAPQERTDTNELAGIYTANHQGTDPDSLYPATSARVEVCLEHDGYHDIRVYNDAGKIVARTNRSHSRVESALSGDQGYDLTVRPEAGQ